MAEILREVSQNTKELNEEGGILKEEQGAITLDLRSLDLSRMTPSHVQMACSPSLHLPRPVHQSPSLGVVTHLLLDYNEIEELPDEIGDIEYLQTLSVMGNQVRCLPEGLGKLRNLETLNINENFVQTLTFSLGGLINLKQLYAIANKISDIESGIFSSMKKLEKIYLDENLLTYFPNDLCELGNLEILECGNNELSNLPDGFGSLHQLATLNLDSNKLTALPQSFSLLMNLKLLLLSNNNIKTLPISFPSAGKLERLILDKNDLTSVPNWFGELRNIKELSIDDNELCNDAFTEEFCMSASEMTKLSAGRNYLTELPANIGNLKNLTWLCLGSTMLELERSNFQSGNWLSSLPDSFTELVNLQRLHLDENQLQLLPHDIGHLCKLEWLDLGQNRLEFLPDSFCELTSLTYLQLSKNKLKALPNNIGNLENLVELRIDSNLLTEIPQSLSKMKSLHSLDLFNNCLTDLPKLLLSLGNLKRLDVEQNRFSTFNIPKLVKENVYPERDKSLQDNWRGKTREDKIKCDVIEMDGEDQDCNSNEEEIYYNENALRNAMRAGMALWRNHDGPTEREMSSICTKQDSFALPSLSVTHADSKMVMFDESLRYGKSLSHQLDEDWDNELRNDSYQDTLDICNKRKNVNSVLIDKFQNNTNRYPPCFHAYSPTACYDSLVYKKAEELSNVTKGAPECEEGQFDDADF